MKPIDEPTKAQIVIPIILRVLYYVFTAFIDLAGIAIIVWAYQTHHDFLQFGGATLVFISVLLMEDDLYRHGNR